ncbi:MAG: SDR family oxidoreductase [Xanthomonadales bacterium]|nr:SDR family oxidoreductase [Gammaproteobacteria bacterium]MBT8054616.1 SDR family oxidoreductase [Gammaproteobacteria bacterium]NND58118.1 SDR family oxidoreductase [Xanthomonadales bacterium]NNK50391.1 SDR family oxidoreductase [Xanthomonadales bacterium]
MDQKANPPRSRYTRRSTAEQVTLGIDLSGKTVLITGCNSGLGFETARVLASRGARIIGAARTLEKAQTAARKIDGEVVPVACELSELDSVAACADGVSSMNQPLDVVICNAGIMALPELQQKYGLEMQFLTNHLGHFVLVNRLLDRVKQAPAGRIVMVSSLGHYTSVPGGINFNNLSGEKNYVPFTFYGQSKLANLLMSNELSRKLRGSNATSNAIHPGIIMTPLMRNIGSLRSTLASLASWPVSRSVEQGAATQCYVATSPGLEGFSGHYFADCNPARMSAHAQNAELAVRLWKVSEELAADYL